MLLRELAADELRRARSQELPVPQRHAAPANTLCA
jgi:hypothetical protein